MNTSTMPYRISIDDIKQIMILTNELNNSNYPANPAQVGFCVCDGTCAGDCDGGCIARVDD